MGETNNNNNTIEETLKTIQETFPNVNLDQVKNELNQHANEPGEKLSFFTHIRKLFLCEYLRAIADKVDDEDKLVIDQIVRGSLSSKETSQNSSLNDELISDVNKLKIYNYIKMQVQTINDDYKEIDYKTIINRLVAKYLSSEKSYNEIQGEIDSDLREIMKGSLQSSNDVDAMYTAVSLNTNAGDMKYDETKAVDIKGIFQKIQGNTTLTEEEKANSFNSQMQNVIIPYIKENLGEEFALKQLASQYKDVFNGTSEYTLEELLTYDVMKNIFSSLEKQEGFFTTEVNVRLFSTIDDEQELITAEGEFNKNALNFEGLDEFYNLRAKGDSNFKIESILWFQFVPKKLLEALKTVKQDEKSSVVLDFIKFYLNELNKYFEEKGISVTLTLENAFAALNDETIPIYFQGQEKQFAEWKHLVAGEIDKVESMINEEKEQEQDLNSPLEMTEEELKDIDEHIKNGTMIKDNPKTLVYQQMNTAVDSTKGTSNTVLIYAMFGLSILLTIFIWVVVMIYR